MRGVGVLLLAVGGFAGFGLGDVSTRGTPLPAGHVQVARAVRRPGPTGQLRRRGADEDPPEVQIGERLFLENDLEPLAAFLPSLNEDYN